MVGDDGAALLVEVAPVTGEVEDRHRAGGVAHDQGVGGLLVALAVVEELGEVAHRRVVTDDEQRDRVLGERVGALTMVTANKEETAPVLSQLKRVIRTNYSNPPTHGAKVVAAVLTNPELYAQWEAELAEMRDRIRDMRAALVEKLQAAGVEQDVSFIQRQRGMFSFSGLSKDQVARLADEFGIYAVGSGRICVAALNTSNIDAVATAMAAVMKG